MRARLPADSRGRNAVILALKGAMEATLTEPTWKELGYATDTIDWIKSNKRLLRSCYWGNDDYPRHVLDALEYILDKDPANLQVLLDFGEIAKWIRENRPHVYAEVAAPDVAAVKSLADAREAAKGFDVEAQIRRIREALVDDPALAVGTTKELLETVLKTVLGLHGAEIGADDMPKLLKRAQAALGLDPKDAVDSTPGAESFRRLLGSLAQVVVSVTEMRNLYGTGHGKSDAPGLDPAAAQLVVAAGTSLAAYLMERYNGLKK